MKKIEDPPYDRYVWACSVGLLETAGIYFYDLSPLQILGYMAPLK